MCLDIQSPVSWGYTFFLLAGSPCTPVVVSENKLNQKDFGSVGPSKRLFSLLLGWTLSTLKLNFVELATQECQDGQGGIIK